MFFHVGLTLQFATNNSCEFRFYLFVFGHTTQVWSSGHFLLQRENERFVEHDLKLPSETGICLNSRHRVLSKQEVTL